MITISFLGLDQFVVGNYSRRHSENLAQAFGVDVDEINFYAPYSMIFHQGVEQTSWNILIIVSAEEKYRSSEAMVAEYLMRTVKDFAVHMEIRFEYHSDEHTYKLINDDYPRYLTENNVVNVDDSYEEDEEQDDNDIYLDDVFQGMEDKLEEANNPEIFKKK